MINGLNNFCWTEDNRLQAFSDKNNGAWYNYDAEGERSLKLTGQTIHVNQNGQDYHIPVFDKQTLYASPLITINDEGYTKHYFEEGKRICSKIGSGELHNVNDILDGISDRAERLVEEQQFGVEKSFEICMGMYSSVKTYNLKEHIIQPYENPIHPDEPIFYYHSDHLGSASFLTDETGIQTQQLVYLPFGEDWVDLKYNTQQFETPYKFNGKEKDLESGYNYYGARYYYDWASIWLSVDPNSDNYPHATSYAYCNNNPIMLIDPDGKDWYQPDDGSSAIYIRGNEKSKIVQGEVYNNIGKSFSAQNMDGSYTNYYQNYAISIGDKQNAEKIAKNNPEVRAFLISNKSNLPLEDKKSLFNSNVASRGINTEAPDMMGLQFSGNAFLGGGGAVDLTVGYMRNEGFFSNASLRIGVGVDISISAGIVTGNYTGGGSPTSSSLSGGSLYQNVGAGFMNCGAGQDIRPAKKDNIGYNWNTRSIGVSFGTKTVYGGSAGVSITTKPFKF